MVRHSPLVPLSHPLLPAGFDRHFRHGPIPQLAPHFPDKPVARIVLVAAPTVADHVSVSNNHQLQKKKRY